LTAPALQFVDLRRNAEPPSDIGFARYLSLINRGVTVYLDEP